MGIQRRFWERRRTPSFYHIFLIYSYSKNREKKKKQNNPLVGNIIHRDLWGWTFSKKNYSASNTIACHPITSITSVTSESTGR